MIVFLDTSYPVALPSVSYSDDDNTVMSPSVLRELSKVNEPDELTHSRDVGVVSLPELAIGMLMTRSSCLHVCTAGS